ncbi:hypothetical protein GOBAR_AA13880 [Gossypium barbadense]|uniref:Uncharacterized protein n=1 Tax=Gossypium barbadense TaxID=3634 RepID=A0A2P5XTW1_GOSBA|nr:hypothetical protein GOBAR_AA13880 [Gossypium barbadense]
MEVGHMYMEEVRKAINARRVRSMSAELYSWNIETFWVQESLAVMQGSRLGPNVNARGCASANLNVEQYINEVYKLECTYLGERVSRIARCLDLGSTSTSIQVGAILGTT